jgi:hypothetical protein
MAERSRLVVSPETDVFREGFAWRYWEHLWDVPRPGNCTIMVRATDTDGRCQPDTANGNVLGYGNKGIREHAIKMAIFDPDPA